MIHRACPLCGSQSSVVKYPQNYNLDELKEEFFRRVDFSNQNFTIISLDREGWETDRGKV